MLGEGRKRIGRGMMERKNCEGGGGKKGVSIFFISTVKREDGRMVRSQRFLE